MLYPTLQGYQSVLADVSTYTGILGQIAVITHVNKIFSHSRLRGFQSVETWVISYVMKSMRKYDGDSFECRVPTVQGYQSVLADVSTYTGSLGEDCDLILLARLGSISSA